MQTPDVTKAMLIALIQPILVCAVAFGVDLSEVQQAAILGLSGAVSAALVIADAIIRKGRAGVVAAAVNTAGDPGVAASPREVLEDLKGDA